MSKSQPKEANAHRNLHINENGRRLKRGEKKIENWNVFPNFSLLLPAHTIHHTILPILSGWLVGKSREVDSENEKKNRRRWNSHLKSQKRLFRLDGVLRKCKFPNSLWKNFFGLRAHTKLTKLIEVKNTVTGNAWWKVYFSMAQTSWTLLSNLTKADT